MKCGQWGSFEILDLMIKEKVTVSKDLKTSVREPYRHLEKRVSGRGNGRQIPCKLWH